LQEAPTIICASAMQFTEEQLKPVAFDLVSVAGIADFNYEYIKTHVGQMLQFGKPVRFETFDGGHSWPPKEAVNVALDWMELQAMRRGLRTKDDGFIEELFKKEQARAAELEAAGKPLQALRLYEALVRDFDGLRDVSGCRAKVAELNARKDLKDAIKWENGVADAHHQRMDKLIMARTALEDPQAGGLRPTSDFQETGLEAAESDIRRSVSSMRKQMEKPFTDRERVISQRVLENFYIDTMFRASDQMSRKDYRTAISNYRACVMSGQQRRPCCLSWPERTPG
jgi:hypothetical protein